MEARKLVFDISDHPILKMVAKVKRARAAMLRLSGSVSYIYFHREIEMEHDDSESCLCDPVRIGNNDYRPSLYFAHQILYPTNH